MTTATKTRQRRDRIDRGSRRGASLADRAGTRAAIQEVRQMHKLPHTDHGASSIDEIQLRQQQAASMSAQRYTAPSSTSADTYRKAAQSDPRRVPLSFLLDDLRRRVKTQTRGYSKAERLDIATDAFMVILHDWTTQGETAELMTARHSRERIALTDSGATKTELRKLRSRQRAERATPIDCGPIDSPPLRRDWYDNDARVAIRDGRSTRPAPNASAERAMRAAVKQAADKRSADTEAALTNRDPAELIIDSASAGDQSTLARAALQREQADADAYPRLPDADAAEQLAQAMSVSLTAARAVIARGWKLSARQCAELWGLSEDYARKALSKGDRELLRQYETSADLMDALDSAGAYLRLLMAHRAADRLCAIRDAAPWENQARLMQRAEQAVSEYYAVSDPLPYQRRAIELAAQRVGWTLAHVDVSEYLMRLLRAEDRRGYAQRTQAGPTQYVSVSPAESLTTQRAAQRARLLRHYGRRVTVGTRAQRVTAWLAAVDALSAVPAPAPTRGLTRHARQWSYGLEAATQREQAKSAT